MTQVNKPHWNFNNASHDANRVAALRVCFMDIHNLNNSNEMFIRIPKGGRCEYSIENRIFYIYDSNGIMFRNVQAPEEAAIDISYIDQDYLNIIDQTRLEYPQDQLN